MQQPQPLAVPPAAPLPMATGIPVEISVQDIASVFERFDKDGSGEIDVKEFKSCLRKMKLELETHELEVRCARNPGLLLMRCTSAHRC